MFKKKILITGGAGFIGSHLTEKLVSLNANVTALSYYNSRGSNGWLDNVYEKIPDNLTIKFMGSDTSNKNGVSVPGRILPRL